MKSALIVLVVAMIGLSAGPFFQLALAQPCTPETCPPGPVQVAWEFENCTGAYQFYPMSAYLGCDNGDLFEVRDHAFVNARINNPTCDMNAANASYTLSGFVFGGCIPGSFMRKKRDLLDDTTSFSVLFNANPVWRKDEQFFSPQGFMFLGNVNDTLPSTPSPGYSFNPHLISYEELTYSETCPGVDNCTYPDGTEPNYYETRYSQDGCSGTVISNRFPNITKDNLCVNYYNYTHMEVGCYGPHGFIQGYKFGSDCQNTPTSYFEAQSYTCSLSSRLTIHCTPPEEPISPQSDTPSDATPSNAFRINAIGSFILIALMIASNLLL